MTNQSITPIGQAQGVDLLDTTAAPLPRPNAIQRLHTHLQRRLSDRGMSTAEYAVGILAAVTFALVLLRVFTGNEFFKSLLQVVLKIMNWMGAQIK